MSKNTRITFMGFMGSGKTKLGTRVAKRMGYDFVDLDHRLVQSEGRTVPEIFEAEGEKGFRKLETHYLEELLRREGKWLIGLGGGAPCSDQNLSLIKNFSLSVFLDVPVDYLVHRLSSSKQKRPLIEGLDKTELKGFVEEKLVSRLPYYTQADVRVRLLGKKLKAKEQYLLDVLTAHPQLQV